jgi:hypothetical protein
MEYLKVREAALKYQISEKTLRKWITSKQLASTTRMVNGVEQYALLPEDIEKLIAEKSLEAKQAQPATSGHVQDLSPDREQITALASELSNQSEALEAMQQKLEALQERVAILERKGKSARRIVADVNYSVPPTEPHGLAVQTPRKAADTSTRPDLPTNWYGWTPFIERHNVSAERRQIMRLDKSDYCHEGEYMMDTGKGKTRVKCALDPDGQERLLAQLWSMEFQTELRPCDIETCPCHEVFPHVLF